LFAGVVAAPLVWLMIAIGQGGSTRTVEGWLDDGAFETADLIEPAAYLAAAGVVLGLIAALRLSPLGPLVAGVLLAGVYLAMFVDPFEVRNAVPNTWDLFGDPIPLRTPLTNGTLLLIGALLLMAVFSVQRWRTWPAGAAAAVPPDTAPGETPPATEPGAGPAEPEAPGTEPLGAGDQVTEPSSENATPPPPANWPASTPPAPAQPTRTATATNGGEDVPAQPGSPTSPWTAPPRPPGTPTGTE
jgi:hypothetical protein